MNLLWNTEVLTAHFALQFSFLGSWLPSTGHWRNTCSSFCTREVSLHLHICFTNTVCVCQDCLNTNRQLHCTASRHPMERTVADFSKGKNPLYIIGFQDLHVGTILWHYIGDIFLLNLSPVDCTPPPLQPAFNTETTHCVYAVSSWTCSLTSPREICYLSSSKITS